MIDKNYLTLLRKKLLIQGVQDVEFPTVQSLDGTEAIPIVHDNINKLLNIDTLLEYLESGYYTIEGYASFITAISSISVYKRKQGMIVSFRETPQSNYKSIQYTHESVATEHYKNPANWREVDSTYTNIRGLYPTEESLRLKVPHPNQGDVAFVGNTLLSSTTYKVDPNGVWERCKDVIDISDLFKYALTLEGNTLIFSTRDPLGREIRQSVDLSALKLRHNVDGFTTEIRTSIPTPSDPTLKTGVIYLVPNEKVPGTSREFILVETPLGRHVEQLGSASGCGGNGNNPTPPINIFDIHCTGGTWVDDNTIRIFKSDGTHFDIAKNLNTPDRLAILTGNNPVELTKGSVESSIIRLNTNNFSLSPEEVNTLRDFGISVVRLNDTLTISLNNNMAPYTRGTKTLGIKNNSVEGDVLTLTINFKDNRPNWVNKGLVYLQSDSISSDTISERVTTSGRYAYLEYKDENEHSSTYNKYKYVRQSGSDKNTEPNWVDKGIVYLQASNLEESEILDRQTVPGRLAYREFRDENPFSPTYNKYKYRREASQDQTVEPRWENTRVVYMATSDHNNQPINSAESVVEGLANNNTRPEIYAYQEQQNKAEGSDNYGFYKYSRLASHDLVRRTDISDTAFTNTPIELSADNDTKLVKFNRAVTLDATTLSQLREAGVEATFDISSTNFNVIKLTYTPQ